MPAYCTVLEFQQKTWNIKQKAWFTENLMPHEQVCQPPDRHFLRSKPPLIHNTLEGTILQQVILLVYPCVVSSPKWDSPLHKRKLCTVHQNKTTDLPLVLGLATFNIHKVSVNHKVIVLPYMQGLLLQRSLGRQNNLLVYFTGLLKIVLFMIIIIISTISHVLDLIFQ